MKIIHFDLGSNMAFAHNGCGDVVITDHFVATGPRQQRQAEILRWLVRRRKELSLAGIKFDVVHYERPFARGFDATRSGWGIAGLIEGVFGSDTVILDSTPQSIKSFALGSKKIARKKMTSAERHAAAAAEKLLMIDAARALGYMGNNEHEADAYLGLKYAEQYTARGTEQCAIVKHSRTPRSSKLSEQSNRTAPSKRARKPRASHGHQPSAKSKRRKSAA
jgi:hypothetical protein